MHENLIQDKVNFYKEIKKNFENYLSKLRIIFESNTDIYKEEIKVFGLLGRVEEKLTELDTNS
jgi:hypothetical protein